MTAIEVFAVCLSLFSWLIISLSVFSIEQYSKSITEKQNEIYLLLKYYLREKEIERIKNNESSNSS